MAHIPYERARKAACVHAHDYVKHYVDDLIRGLYLLAESGEHLPVNLGNPDHEVTMLDLAQACIRLAGSNSEIVYEALPVDDPRERRPDITRAQQILGWEPEIGLDEGIGRWLVALGSIHDPSRDCPAWSAAGKTFGL